MNTKPQKTVSVFLTDGKKILLHKRLDTWFQENHFAVPGGLVDRDEEPNEAAVRELFEETSLMVEIENLKLIRQTLTHENGKTYENFYFHADKYSGTPTNSEPNRHSDLDWYSVSNLPEPTMKLVADLITELAI